MVQYVSSVYDKKKKSRVRIFVLRLELFKIFLFFWKITYYIIHMSYTREIVTMKEHA